MGKLLQLPTQEEKLVKRCRRGNPEAQRELYQKFAPAMLSICRRYVRQLEDAEEVLSNGFIKVFTKIDQFEGKGSIGGWIKRIMINESLNYIRYQKNIFVEVEEENDLDFSHQQLSEQLNAEHLLEMIGRLPTGYRAVFNLFAIEGYSHKEISDMLGISENTSKSQLSKARRRLQVELSEQHTILYKRS